MPMFPARARDREAALLWPSPVCLSFPCRDGVSSGRGHREDAPVPQHEASAAALGQSGPRSPFLSRESRRALRAKSQPRAGSVQPGAQCHVPTAAGIPELCQPFLRPGLQGRGAVPPALLSSPVGMPESREGCAQGWFGGRFSIDFPALPAQQGLVLPALPSLHPSFISPRLMRNMLVLEARGSISSSLPSSRFPDASRRMAGSFARVMVQG